MPSGRRVELERATAETRVSLSLCLDGQGATQVKTGIGFFDHMLTSLGHHALFDLDLTVAGDLHVDAHHTVEDAALALGAAVDRALGERRGVARFGHAIVPMDEALVLAAVDLSGRPLLVWDVPALDAPGTRLGEMDAELVREFFQALAGAGRLTLHVRQLSGRNRHHVAEAAFKAFARAIRRAVAIDPDRPDRIPSTKELL